MPYKPKTDHQRLKEAKRYPVRPIERLPSSQRGYDANHRKIRNIVLRSNPWCALCGKPAKVLDHIIPLNAGGTNELSNLQPLCTHCHSSIKTPQDIKDYGFNNGGMY